MDDAGHVLKINRAHDHLGDLEREIAAWLDFDGNFTHRVEVDADDATKIHLVATAKRVPLTPLSLIVGDIVHNIRSSLDYIAFELAIAHSKTLTKPQARKSQFPIIGDEDANGATGVGEQRWRESLLRDLQCVSPTTQAIIESVQPFKLGDAFAEHPLWLLHELSNIDKHRFLHVAAACVGKLKLEELVVPKKSLKFNGFRVGEEPTIVASFSNVRPIDPQKTVDMNIIPERSVVFGDGPLEGYLVCITNSNIHTFVATEVLMPLENLL